MQPSRLTIKVFAQYPPEAHAVAAKELPLLRELPLVLLPILLRELIGFDWKMPAERRELEKQFTYLAGLSASERARVLAGFQALPLEADLIDVDWVNNPSGFMEKLTAWLWSTHRMDSFRALADGYAAAVSASIPGEAPSRPRLGMVVVGSGVDRADFSLFRKLRTVGIHLSRVIPGDGLQVLTAEASRRAAESGGAYLHWSIDGGGGSGDPGSRKQSRHLTCVSYGGLEQPRARLLERIQRSIASGKMGPEELRSLLARLQPAEIGLSDAGEAGVLSHFQLSLLTEGAGAQIFATTFVQWAARECIRRAQPETLLVRYAPRQQAQTMNAMISGAPVTGTDPEGSLRDADMGAYYTWLNMRRLSGADQMRFLVWFEGHGEAVAIGPGLPQGTSSDSPMAMGQVLKLLA